VSLCYTTTELEDLARAASQSARRAAAAIMAIYEGGFDVTEKPDLTPLTAADLASHHILESELGALDESALALSEESSPERFDRRRSARRIWLIDPLDGTREFVKRNGEFCINVALVEDGEVVLGILLHPPSGTLWRAVRGGGAWREDAHGERRIEVARHCPPVPRAAASRSHNSPAVEGYLAALGEHERRSQGSALKFTLIAEGEADIYPRLGSGCSEWDVAAGQCVIVEAGGVLVDETGKPPRYNQRDSVKIRHFLAWGDPTRDWLQPLDGIALLD
jgi:3'(2'), 5'-bisphosphate nucleotidase